MHTLLHADDVDANERISNAIVMQFGYVVCDDRVQPAHSQEYE